VPVIGGEYGFPGRPPTMSSIVGVSTAVASRFTRHTRVEDLSRNESSSWGTTKSSPSCASNAFMRLHEGRLGEALEFCRSLGSHAADCAQGAYHDYWFAVAGLDEAKLPADAVTDPYELCAAQPRAFVRPCWYRAFVDNRPEGFQLDTADDLDGLCGGLRGVQRGACMTAASVIGPPDPAAQLELCAALSDEADAANCVRGTKMQNLLGASNADYVELIEGCELFDRAPRAACYRWLGKTLAVVTDGSFGHEGCPQLARADSQRLCEEGARSMDEALVTFS
jgi:hypothetical protein